MKSQQKGKFSSDTEVNPREHCNAITLRSGKMVEESKPKEIMVPTSDVIVTEERQKIEAKGTKIYKPYSISFSDNPPILKPPLPFPQRFMKKKFDDQFAKFLEVFKKIHINIPFAEALAQMPNYTRFLKEVMSNKKKLEEFETIKLTEGCSDILQKLLHKLKDPGSFNIPCNIGGITFNRALCDLGASINLMPLSVFKKLGLGEVKPTTLTLQLVDRSITYPKDMIEDVLVKVDKFIFPVDFVVLDMEENEKIPLILGRPFLATGRALIDVQEGKLTLRVNEEHVTFNIHQVEKPKEKVNICNIVQSADAVLGHREKKEVFYDPLEQYMALNYLVRNASTDGKYSGAEEVVDFIFTQEADPPDKKEGNVAKPLKPPNIVKLKEVLKATSRFKPPDFIGHATVKENAKPRVKFRNKRDAPPEDPP